MKPVLAVLVLGVASLNLQSAVAAFLPAYTCPDFSLLIVIAIGLCWRSAVGGLLMSAGLGYAADALSGSMLGQHALLRVVTFALTRFADRRLNLTGTFPLVIFSAGASVAYGLSLSLLSEVFAPMSGDQPLWLEGLGRHAMVNALCAPLVLRGVQRAQALAGTDEGDRRVVRMALRGRPA